MRFWDTSALIPLTVEEAQSDRMRLLLEEDRSIAIAAITPLEIASVLWRRRHAGFGSTSFVKICRGFVGGITP